MFREITKPDSRKEILGKDGGSSHKKAKETTSKKCVGTSKNSGSAIEKREHIADTGPAFIDYASLSSLQKPLISEPESYVYVDSYLNRTVTWDSSETQNSHKGYPYTSSNHKSPGPWSASTTESHLEQTPVFSATSSFGTNMSDPPDFGQVSETRYLTQALNSDALTLGVVGPDAWLPGKIVKVLCFDEDEETDDENEEPLSYDDFIESESARTGKIERFALYKTFPDYSLAIRIYSYDPTDPKELSRDSEDQAFIYTDVCEPVVKAAEKPPRKPAIQVKPYDSEKLPKESRLDYSDVFTVEHNQMVRFVGEITSTSWEVFASTFHSVQSRITGYEVALPTRRRETAVRCSFDLTPGDTYVPPSATNTGKSSKDLRPSASERQPASIQPKLPSRPVVPPRFGGPSSSRTSTGESNSKSNVARTSAEQNATGAAGWFNSYRSEPPINREVHPSETKAETSQRKSSPRFAGYRPGYGIGEMGQRSNNEMWQTQQMASSVISAFTDRGTIDTPQRWIESLACKGREMLGVIAEGTGKTLEEVLYGLRERRKKSKNEELPKNYAASRVRVAILDGNVNHKSEVFAPYSDRIKGFKDFVEDGEPPPLKSHGTNTSCLFLNIAPEADVYIGRALHEGDTLAKAIFHAVKVWKVDIISISGGTDSPSNSMRQVLQNATSKNISIFAATHNEGGNRQMAWPARAPNVYPVSSSDLYGKPSASAVDPRKNKLNYCTLGENIPTFWMAAIAEKLQDRQLYTLESGSSLSTPIAAAIFATTLLCARLVYDSKQYSSLPVSLDDREVMDGLLRRVSNKTDGSAYLYVQPCKPGRLWSEKHLAIKYQEVMEYVHQGVELT